MTKKSVNFRLLLGGKIIAGVFVLFTGASVHAQQTGDSSQNIEQGKIDDLPAKPFRLPALAEINGSPFLSPEYRQGSVELGQGRIVNNVPVKFNVMNNAMMVMKNGEELKLEFFELVSYDESANDGSSKHFIFKAGYPEIDGHNDNTIYQVLSMGPKVHLLKFISQKVEDANTLGDYSRREIITTEQLYIYVPGSGIKKIKKDKQSLVDALPAFSSKITELAGAKKLKSEADISSIIEQLNKS